MTRQTYDGAPRLTKLATAHISKGGVFIHVHVCCSFMCMGMRMCVLVYVCAGVCEHVAHSCVHVCRAFVGMPCVNVYLYTKKIHQTGHCE